MIDSLMISPSTPLSHPTYTQYARLYAMGVIQSKKSLAQVDRLSVASFCRRRLAVVMVRNKMSETIREAATFIEQVRTHHRTCGTAQPLLCSGPAGAQVVCL